jgi:hypothetical protein
MRIRELDDHGDAMIELADRGISMRVLYGSGPRIAWFGRAENLLYWDDAGAHSRGAWRLRGGHRLWVTRPGADEAEETYASDNARCSVRRHADGIAITAPPDAAKIEKRVRIRVARGAWTIEHRLRNVGDMLWAGGAWAVTCTRPRRGTRYRIPLDGGAPSWDVVTVVIPRRWGGIHTSRLDDPQLVMTADALEARALGTEAKRMLFAPRGTLEMRGSSTGTFAKTAAPIADGAYPLGTNVAIYLAPDGFMAELETMSPMRTLRPGESLSHVETWTLR